MNLILYGGCISMLTTSGTSELANRSVSSSVNVVRTPKRHSCMDMKCLHSREHMIFGCHAKESLLADPALGCSTGFIAETLLWQGWGASVGHSSTISLICLYHLTRKTSCLLPDLHQFFVFKIWLQWLTYAYLLLN